MLIKNLKGKKKKKKLDNIKVGIFFIKAKKKNIIYKFKPLKNTKVYFVYYILLLKLVDPETPV